MNGQLMKKSKEEADKPLMKKHVNEAPAKPWYREWSEALVVAFIIAMILRTFVIQAFKIPSGSMEDTLLIGDHLLVNKFLYGTKIPFTDSRILPIRDPQRGDVIVFEFPGDKEMSFWSRRDFIKRVIGVPGDVVEVRNKNVYVNGELVKLPQEVHKSQYVIPGCTRIGQWDKEAPGYVRDCMKPVTVPEDSYFVMGDNRDYSRDSRFWGFVPQENIKGFAFIKYWSWDSGENWPRFSRIGRTIE